MAKPYGPFLEYLLVSQAYIDGKRNRHGPEVVYLSDPDPIASTSLRLKVLALSVFRLEDDHVRSESNSRLGYVLH